jgi:hypothetical protein
MKYWNELTNVESELIRLDTIVSLVRSLNYSIEGGLEFPDVKNCLWKIEEELDLMCRHSNIHFQELWDVVRNDTHVEFDGYTAKKAADELENVVNSWVKE